MIFGLVLAAPPYLSDVWGWAAPIKEEVALQLVMVKEVRLKDGPISCSH